VQVHLPGTAVLVVMKKVQALIVSQKIKNGKSTCTEAGFSSEQA
jgi:hypothetical protein